MSNDRKIFIEHQKVRLINHGSLGSQLDVISAGELHLKEGMIKELNENSGHYRPKNRVFLIEEEFKERDVIFHPDYKCKSYLHRKYIK